MGDSPNILLKKGGLFVILAAGGMADDNYRKEIGI